MRCEASRWPCDQMASCKPINGQTTCTCNPDYADKSAVNWQYLGASGTKCLRKTHFMHLISN